MSISHSPVRLGAFERSRRSGSRAHVLTARSGGLSLVLFSALACLLSAAASAHARPTIEYEVSRKGATKANYDHFHYTVDAVLEDPRGWSLFGAVTFKHVSRGGRFTVRLTEPRVVGSYEGCSTSYSCRVGRYVMINDRRWRYGTQSYEDEPIHHYRQMVVNHEVGHALGFGHRTCGRSGWRAPVMQQQSKGLGGCKANPWPLPSERRALARRLGVRVGAPPPGIEIGDRIGPIDLGARRKEVLGRIGGPTPPSRSSDSVLTYQGEERLVVTIANERVAAVSTRSQDFSTSSGARVGLTRSQARSRLSGESCGARSCVIAGGGGVLTTFVIKDGRVKKISIER